MLRSDCSADSLGKRLYLFKKVKGDDLDITEVQMHYFDIKFAHAHLPYLPTIYIFKNSKINLCPCPNSGP